MALLYIQRKVEIPTVATWKWQAKDYEVPLVFALDTATAHLYLDYFSIGKRDRDVLWDAKLLIIIKLPTKKLLRALSSKASAAEEAANKIYAYYEEVFDKFEAIARTAGNMKNLLVNLKTSKKKFFEGGTLSSDKVTWWVDKEKPKTFSPDLKKGRRRINPLFRKEQIITKAKWRKMQSTIDANDYPSPELLELLRIRSKLEWRQNKIATIESAVLVEALLRDYGQKVLQSLSVSKTKLRSLEDEMSFNTLLNIVLPLSLSKPELRKVEKHLKTVDLLRKQRNDVVHGNISDDEIEIEHVRKGIEGSLVLVEVLRKKLEKHGA